MGFYEGLKEISASKNSAAQNAQQAAATMAELRLKGAENLNKNLQGIGNAIMDYAKVRYTMDKDARDEAFRQSELNEKTRQFDTAQANQMQQFREKLAENARQFDAQGENRKADAAYKRAAAYHQSEQAQKMSAVRKLENDVEAAEKAKSETKTTPQTPSADENFNKLLNTEITNNTALTAGQGNPPSTQTGAGLLGSFAQGVKKASDNFKDGKLIAQDDKNAPRIPSI